MIKIDFLRYIGKETMFGKQTWFGYMWLPTSEQWIRWKRKPRGSVSDFKSP